MDPFSSLLLEDPRSILVPLNSRVSDEVGNEVNGLKDPVGLAMCHGHTNALAPAGAQQHAAAAGACMAASAPARADVATSSHSQGRSGIRGVWSKRNPMGATLQYR